MYMKQDINILIARLKQVARQGIDPRDTKKVEYTTQDAANNKELDAHLNKLKTSSESLLDTFNTLNTVVDAFNTKSLQLGTGISKLTADFESYAKGMIGVVKESTFLEQRNKELNKAFGVTSAKAAELGAAYDNIGERLALGGNRIRKYAAAINSMLPGMGEMIAKSAQAGKGYNKFSESLMASTNLLTEHMHISDDNAKKYQLYAASTGKTALEMMKATEEMAKAFEAKGMTGVYQMAISEISNLAEDTLMTYRKYPGQLEKSVVKAKLMGTEFAKIEAMATKMLDIETSVGQELEYQLLSGKRLVNQQGESITENLRMAKLSGNSADAVKAMNDLLTTQGDILDGNNHYAKQELANLTGYSIDELQRMKQTRALLAQTGMSEDKVNEILALDGPEFDKAIANMEGDQKKLFESLKKDTSQQTTDQLFAEFMEKERDAGIKVMLGGSFENQQSQITKARKDVETGQQDVANYAKKFMTEELATTLGALQQEGVLLSKANEHISNIVEKIPIVGDNLDKAIKYLDGWAKKFYGTTKTTTTTTTTTDGGSGGDLTDMKPNSDAHYVNDGLIKFNPNDKFAIIPPAAELMASTSPGALENSVEKRLGMDASSKSSTTDSAAMASAIASAVTMALQNMSIAVNYNPLAAKEQLGFKLNQSINGEG